MENYLLTFDEDEQREPERTVQNTGVLQTVMWIQKDSSFSNLLISIIQ